MKKLTRIQVRCAEMLLTFPRIQSRTPEANNVRDCLIRQIWWGDRVLAAWRDGREPVLEGAQLEINRIAAGKALNLLRNSV